MAFLKFSHFLWEASKPTIVLTHNKSVIRFLQTKAIRPSSWNACNYVLQFKFKILYFAGSVNTAADFFFRLGLKVTKKFRLKIREYVQTKPIEVTTSSPDVADEVKFFILRADSGNETEEQILEQETHSRKKATELIGN